MTDSPGQQCVRECRRLHGASHGACTSCIDALVRRERAGVLDGIAERLADWDLAHLLIQIGNTLSREATKLRARAAQEEKGDG